MMKKEDCIGHFQSILRQIASPGAGKNEIPERELNEAFLDLLSGRQEPGGPADKRLRQAVDSDEAARFYLRLLETACRELAELCDRDGDFALQLADLARFLEKDEHRPGEEDVVEKCWSVFFPEGIGALSNREKRISELREKRKVKIENRCSSPVTNPASQLIFTSNALLTVPHDSESVGNLDLSDGLKEKIKAVCSQQQQNWYDHPVPLDATIEANEIIYGLKGLSQAVEFERKRGNVKADRKIKCVLSVSVTHDGIQEFARRYIKEVLDNFGGLDNIDVYVFTEADTCRIADEVLGPAMSEFLEPDENGDLQDVFGVDGSYGRHYTFLKAVAAFWHVLVDPGVNSTFKIDLDQVFPQEVLVRETGKSAFEHFETLLWGAEGSGADGEPLDLGMIAGALVNESDIEKSLFTPDVTFPTEKFSPEYHFFFSGYLGAVSTAGELMTRYGGDIDGSSWCIQRVHVTGGTNGIRVDALRRHRPFTPTFIGRAEDQAYLLSVFPKGGRRLAYLHEDGLIMRHDKAAFAGQAIEAAKIGRIAGEYVRTLYFSEYARVLTDGDPEKLKQLIDPFTGCFVSRLPVTIVAVRLALTASSFFSAGQAEDGAKLVRECARRLSEALNFTSGSGSGLKKRYGRERWLWNRYYDVLDVLEKKLIERNPAALELQNRATAIVEDCRLS